MFNPRALLLAVFVACLSLANAADTHAHLHQQRSIERRQLEAAAPDCTLARITILGALATASLSIQQISDVTVQQSASSGVQEAIDSIQTAAMALIEGQPPAADAKEKTKAALDAAKAALDGGNASDAAVAKAKEELNKASVASEEAAANC